MSRKPGPEPGTYLVVWPIEDDTMTRTLLEQEARAKLQEMAEVEDLVLLGQPEFEVVEDTPVVETPLAFVARVPALHRRDWRRIQHGQPVRVAS